MKLSEYLDAQGRGARVRLAAEIGAHASDMSDWAMGDRPVPARRCVAIERATNGAVTRRDLRPDDCHLIWPDLADSKQNQPAAPGHQALEAINSKARQVAQGVAHG